MSQTIQYFDQKIVKKIPQILNKCNEKASKKLTQMENKILK